MAFKLRPHSKDQSKALNPEPSPEKRPIVLKYDKDGIRIGDDGYPMTPKRKRMHRLFNAIFVWGIIAAVIGAILGVASFGQGQQYAGFELETYGGNMYNGMSVANLMRYEGLFCMFTAIFGTVLQVQGFRWFYDKHPFSVTGICMGIIAGVSFIFEGYALIVVGILEPVSLINILFTVLIAVTIKQVNKERPTLKKARVVSTKTI